MINELKRMQSYLSHLGRKATIEAKRKFPNHPRARSLWVKLASGDGGFDEIVSVLNLEEEYTEYKSRFNEYCDKGMTESAANEVEGFSQYLCSQLEDNFYLFN